MKKKIILISLGVVVLLIAGALLYISVIDWNQHKERISSQLSASLGEKIEISGNLKVSLFPHPIMSAKSVNMINPQNNEKLATINQLDTAITLSSFLRGAPEIKSLSLVGVEMWIKFNNEGQSNWHQDVKSDSFGNSNEMRLQSFNMQNSIVHFDNKKYDIHFDLTNLNAEVQATTIYGPYRLDGNFMKNSDRYGMAFSIDSLSQTEDVNLTFAIVHPGSDSYLRYDGSYNLATDAFKGVFSGNSQHSADFLNALMSKLVLNDDFNTPLLFSVEVDADNNQMSLEHFAITYDGLLEGSGDIVIPRGQMAQETPMNIKYQMVSLDVRPIMEIIKSRLKEYQQGKAYEPNLPFDVTYDLSAVRVVYNDRPDGVMENVSAKGIMKDKVFSVDDFYAGCAGDFVLTMSGNVAEQDGLPNGVANVAMEGKNFQAFMNAFGVELEAPNQGAYREAKISASLSATPLEVNVDEVRANIDKSDITAAMKILLESNEYQISLKADKVNFDNYIFPLKEEDPQDIISIIKHDLAEIAKIQNKTINLKTEIQAAVFRGMNMKNLQAEVDYKTGELDIIQAQTEEFLGSTVNFSAILKEIESSSPQIEMFTYNIKSRDFPTLARKLQITLPQWELFNQKNFATSGTLSGSINKVQLKSETKVDSDEINYEGTLENDNGFLKFEGVATVKTTRLESLLDKMGIDSAANKLYRGVFNGTANIAGAVDNFVVNDLDFQLGTARYGGNLTVKKDKNLYELAGNINTNEFNLAQLLKMQSPKAPAPNTFTTDNTFLARPNLGKAIIDFSPYRDVVLDIQLSAQKSYYNDYVLNDLQTHILNAQNVLEFQNMSFVAGETNVSGNIKIEYTQAPRIKGLLTFSNMTLDNFGGTTYALFGNNLRLENEFEASASSFEDMLGSLTGRTSFSLKGLKIKGINLTAIADDLRKREQSKGLFQVVQDNLKRGETEFEPLEGSIVMKNGVLQLSKIPLVNPQTKAVVDGDINLKDWKINLKTDVKYNDLPNIDDYSSSFSGALNKPVVDVSIEKIVRKYDEYWQKIAQEEQELKDTQMRELADKMTAAQKKVEELSDKATKVTAALDDFISKKQMAETADLYRVKKERMSEIVREIQAMQSKANQLGFTENDVQNIEVRASELNLETDAINSDIKSIFVADLDKKQQEIKERETVSYNECQKIDTEYQQSLRENTKKLAEIRSEKYISDNADVKKQKAEMKQYFDTVIMLHKDFNTKMSSMAKTTSDDGKIAKIGEMERIAIQMEPIAAQMKAVQETLSELLQKIVIQRQEEIKQAQLEAERKRLQEEKENEGNLLVSDEKPRKEEKVTIEKKSVVLQPKTPAPQPAADETFAADEPAVETAPTPAAATSETIEIIHTDLPDTIENTDEIPEAKEVPLDKISGGMILRTYEDHDVEVVDQPVKPLLKPVTGSTPKSSGTIFVP